MFKKILIGLMFIMMCAGIGGTVYFYLGKMEVIADRDVLLQQNSQLQQSLDAIGPITKVYTVKAQVRPGTEISRDDFIEMSIPASAVSEDAITDLTQLFGTDPTQPIPENDKLYYKVTINPGTALTKDLLMTDKYDNPYYERDLAFDFKPIGLKIGDYVNIMIRMPDGENFIALSHKRVYGIYENTIKLKLQQGELSVYDTCLIDKATYGGLGWQMYPVKYVEPGLVYGGEPLQWYPVSISEHEYVMMDENIPQSDKNRYVNYDLRTKIEDALNYYTQLQQENEFKGRKPSSSVESEISALQSALQVYNNELEEKEREEMENGTGNLNGEQQLENNDISGSGINGQLTTEEDLLTGNDGFISTPAGSTTGGTGQQSQGTSLNDIQSNLNNSTSESYDRLQQIGQDIQQGSEDGDLLGNLPQETLGNVDADGNQANISNSEKEDAKQGENLFEGVEGL